MDNNRLQHWGIKGMKWGRRRWQNQDGSLTPAGRARYDDDDGDDSPRSRGVHDDHAKAHAGKSVSEMSTKELQDWSNRRRLEKEYQEANMTTGDKFKRWAMNSAKEVGSQVAKDYARRALDSAVNMGLSKIGASTNSEGVKSFLQGMGIKWKEKPKVETPKPDNAPPKTDNAQAKADAKSAKQQAKADDKAAKQKVKEEAGAAKKQAKEEADAETSSTKKPYETPTADISPKMSKGVKKAFKDVLEENKNSETANETKSKKRDYPESWGDMDEWIAEGDRISDERWKAGVEAQERATQEWTRARDQQAKADAKAAKQQAKADTKQTYEADAVLKKAYESPEADFSKYKSNSRKDNTIYSDDYKDKSEPTITFTSGGKSTSVSSAKASMIKAMASSGNKTVSEIADKVGVSPSTVQYYLPPPKKKDEKK